MRKLFKERKLFKGGNYMRKYGIRINLGIKWIISRIPRGISKIIFVQGSYESLVMLDGKNRQGPFFYGSIL